MVWRGFTCLFIGSSNRVLLADEYHQKEIVETVRWKSYVNGGWDATPGLQGRTPVWSCIQWWTFVVANTAECATPGFLEKGHLVFKWRRSWSSVLRNDLVTYGRKCVMGFWKKTRGLQWGAVRIWDVVPPPAPRSSTIAPPSPFPPPFPPLPPSLFLSPSPFFQPLVA